METQRVGGGSWRSGRGPAGPGPRQAVPCGSSACERPALLSERPAGCPAEATLGAAPGVSAGGEGCWEGCSGLCAGGARPALSVRPEGAFWAWPSRTGKTNGVWSAPGRRLTLPRLQAAGPANSSVVTRARRSSARASWATSCCRTASPAKVKAAVLRGQQDGRRLPSGALLALDVQAGPRRG